MKYSHIIKHIWKGNMHYGCMLSELKCSQKIIHSTNKYTKNVSLNLTQIARSYTHAAKVIVENVKLGKGVLFFTRKEHEELLIRENRQGSLFFIFKKWINGLLSNFFLFRKVINRFKVTSIDKENFTKKELAVINRNMDLKRARYEGVIDMTNKPSIVVLASYSASIVKEANENNIKCIIWSDGSKKPDDFNIYIFSNNNYSGLELLLKLIKEGLAQTDSF